MTGSKFSSFKNLDQYKNFKEAALYSHFGVFNEEYYALSKSIQELEIQKDASDKEVSMLNSIIEKIDSEISGTEYCGNSQTLDKEIENTKSEYEEIVIQLNNTKTKLIELRNTKIDLENSVIFLKNNIKSKDSIIKKFNSHTCPVCHSNVEPIFFTHHQFDKKEDYLYLNQTLETDLISIKEEIEKESNFYNGLANQLKKYNEKIHKINKNIDSVIKHKGFIEMRDKIQIDLYNINERINEINKSLKEEKKKIKKYIDLKKLVNEKYFNLMIEGKSKFNLKEIEDSRFENIKNNFEIGGSNKPISTIIWYFNLLRLKYEFNPNCVRFPIVLDSPNNAELDDTKKKELFEYIFKNVDKDSQLIISTLGFEENEFDTNFGKIINLDNEKYELLSNAFYNKYIDFYKNFIEQ